ncbi:MAG TPA: hypothetical protein VKV73_25840 [Chloroflexota bacterium]|nr:hypothetical protein [Chloroflexota bacterium]
MALETASAPAEIDPPLHSSARPARGRNGARKTAFLLALIAFVVYNANLRELTSFDTYPTRFIPISVLQHFTLELDQFPFLTHYPAVWSGNGVVDTSATPYYITLARGHVLSRFPVMAGILATPVYVVPVLLGLTNDSVAAQGYSRTEILATFLSKIAASLAAALSVGVVYLTLLRLTTHSGALWISLIYAFATSTWALSSQGLWQTSMSQPLIALTFYFLVKARQKPVNAIYASIPLALAVAARPTVIVLALALVIHVAHAHRAQLARFLVAPAIVGALLVAYNEYYFASIFGPYAGVGGVSEVFALPTLDALLGLLVSPSRGILVYSPVLMLGAIGLVIALVRRSDSLLTAIAASTVLTILVYACWSQWDGGFSYSYRFLVDLVPGLMLLLASMWGSVATRRWSTGLFVAAAGFSLFIQVVGAFDYPCNWTSTPVEATANRGRFWDWTDPEFVRCAQAGPVDPDGLRFLRSVLAERV